MTFIMLNPSTADAEQDDATIRRCIGFARRHNCSELIVVNLFAYRATNPRELYKAHDPVGPDNMEHVLRALEDTYKSEDPGYVVCAWGAHGKLMDQDETVLGWIEGEDFPAYCLAINKDGTPKHPLYMPADAQLIPYHGRK
jgi:hypothetical protein